MTKFSQLFSVCHMAHCVKIVQTRSFFWSVVSRTQAEYEPENTLFLDTIHAVAVGWMSR